MDAAVPDARTTQPAPFTQVTLFGYVPTEWICALFVALFSTTTIVHIGQAIYYKIWWLLYTAVIAGIFEIFGWSGRLWASLTPDAPNFNPYLMQITTTIIAPTPLVAANFLILGLIIKELGTRFSRLSAVWYATLFISCDLIALVVQAVGGAMASQAVRSGRSPEQGGHIMLGGIVFQMAAIVAYVLLAGEFLVRYTRDSPVGKIYYSPNERQEQRTVTSPRMKLMIVGMGLMTVFIFIRSIYRTIELVNGFSGTIIRTEVLFNVLDGAMITLAMFTLNVFHPGTLLFKRGLATTADLEFKEVKAADA
ncbi:RTA1-domain-containing protein [Vararia minispora EC-137]|uniref:RTA1-domain-containing protein n=1 Tax=Vararia minispora EC-137 TaxID=1314806 RepID=A0ACB8QUY9_9AGAM|nr:RTA1-domain-containing protein [Vararia minispora EC-137]